MNKQQIDKLKALDPTGCNGTVQTVLLRADINEVQFSDACFWLLKQTLIEKEAVTFENKRLSKVLKDHGLYTSELILGGL